MDVEYIPLETSDEFICQGYVKSVGENMLVVKNFKDNGDIFLFDREGKGLRKINRLGRGSEEYISTFGIVLDEDKNELFVNDFLASRILVYDLFGKHKRSFRYRDSCQYMAVFNFDANNLICYDSKLDNLCPFQIISKLDGSVTKMVDIRLNKRIEAIAKSIDVKTNAVYSAKYSSQYPIIPYFSNWILLEPSSDTVYQYSPDHSIHPLLCRTPSIHSMDPKVFLFMGIITDRYIFSVTVKNEYDFKSRDGFPSTGLVYDKLEGGIFNFTVYNNDYKDNVVFMNSDPLNGEIASWQLLHAHKLVKVLEEGKLSGELKEIASTLDEESNPVIMLLKHKKK